MNKPAAQRLKEWTARLGLILGSTLLILVILELGLRATNGDWLWSWPNFVLGARTVHAEREESRFLDDPIVGYVPRPGYRADGVTFDAQGFRVTGPALAGDPVLAVGDSYTYGDEVKDAETWPSHLQTLLGKRVLNGGVSGYGFDQSVLRAETAALKVHPSAIVVSFIADDIRRTEMKRMWGAEKPYFDFEDGKLVPKNMPVPPRPDPRTTLTFWQRTLGYSFLFDFTLRRLNLLYDWFGDHIRVHPSGEGEAIACALTGRLVELQKTSGARVVLLAEYDPVVWQDPKFEAEQRHMAQDLLACAARNGLATIDSFDALQSSGNPRGLYGLWHLNDKGNALIANLVAKELH